MSEVSTQRPDAARWRLVAAVAAVLVGLFAYRLLSPFPARQIPETLDLAAETAVVTLEVRQPEAESTEVSVPWLKGLTVAQATQQAGLRSVWRGSGEMAFLESLAGTENQGADGLNWQFEVNGDYADRGAGAVGLEPGDRVLWKLAPYE